MMSAMSCCPEWESIYAWSFPAATVYAHSQDEALRVAARSCQRDGTIGDTETASKK
jgi:hypothetical protein